MAAFKGKHFPGEHEPIIERELWDTVQDCLERGEKKGTGQRTLKVPAILKGLLFSDQGNAFTPGWTSKGNKIYRYYINTQAIKVDKDACEVSRFSAGEIEMVVVEQLRQVLRSPEVLGHAVHELGGQWPKISETEAIEALQSIDEVWSELFPVEQARILQTLIERITVRRNGINIAWKTEGMSKLLRDTLALESLKEAT